MLILLGFVACGVAAVCHGCHDVLSVWVPMTLEHFGMPAPLATLHFITVCSGSAVVLLLCARVRGFRILFVFNGLEVPLSAPFMRSSTRGRRQT